MRVWAVNSMNSAFSGACTSTPELPGQHHDAAALRGGVGQTGEHGGAGQFGFRDAGQRQKAGRLAVADGDGAGLVEQQNVHVSGDFHRLAALGDHVGLQRPVHPRDADGRKQAADGRGNQADQQRHQRS